ncbi:MAG: type II toxin-antitoxin system VapC family toxin [Candidatus Andeanibacterium colombiense]|uniref:Type II toxin-antitoxin system VapC family toxin n=1 Tax=Candidatus Andeanibacterium colombiense TaxID=3121345 RepID=A0AAJ5X771_9SPHN|nr:MAG: type II toxin-antitoxin system VapC family toxin [Sphingomonadaceae bacterium]
MEEFVLDASALLATLQDEPGAAAIDARLNRACISTVNLAEVVTKLTERGTPSHIVSEIIEELELDIRDFEREHAERAGLLRPATRALGLSLGDRACLALAEALGRTAITTDRIWSKLDLGIAIEVIRQA